jgi:anti-sigma B factor antagonist
MNISITDLKHCSLVKLSGRIDSASSPQLQEEVDKVLSKGQHKIVFDLAGVEFMSSAGLRVLVITQKNCRKHGHGELVLAATPQNIMAALELTGFVPLFKFFDDPLVAVGSF